VDEDCITRMCTTSLEGIAEMQQIFQKMSLSHDASPLASPSLITPTVLQTSDWKIYKVHDSVDSVQD